MRFNDLHPAPGSRRKAKRVGRGTASGDGKTGGRGHKGQKARAGGGSARGFEGGQMPLHRRLPKFGFSSRKGRFSAELRVGKLASLKEDTVDLEMLKAAKLVARRAQRVKIIAGGKLERAVVVKDVIVTRGARAAIEAAGGKVQS
ncbi:MAG TPA: 50S ribosomal protein L15 [Gammaproteobacteria bacterium]|nr:50S ribosomal protein L15 [Gammaproteobacteria bacterium]